MNKTASSIIRVGIFFLVLIVMCVIGFIMGLFSLEESMLPEFGAVQLVKVLIMCSGVIMATSLIQFFLSLPKPKNHRLRSMLSIISSVISYIAFITILCWGLSILGVDISTIIAGVGIVALIVGFSAQSLIADVVTGTFMIFENQYNVGDIIEVDGFRGTVTSIGIRTTCITDASGNVKIINNSSMKNILNRSDKVSRSVCDFGIPYETDLEKLEKDIPAVLEKMYADHQDIMKSAPVYLGVQELADSAVVLRFIVDVDEQNIFSGARILNHDLFIAFKKLGVEVPFPQMDVHSK